MSRAYKAMRYLVTGAVALSLAACGLAPVPLGSPRQTDVEANQAPEPTANEPEAKTESAPSAGGEAYLTTEAMSDEAYYAMPEPVYNTEEYASVEETGFVATATTPLSTVSADVDTASYANLRRMLRDGYKVASEDQSANDKGGEQAPDEVTPYDDVYDYPYASQGVIPTGAVRIEEMLNYFDYNYDLPKGDDGFGVTARVGACPWNKDTNLLVLGFATAHEDEAVAKKGSNLVFLIDVSGSMDEADKLPLLQSAFGELTKGLGENDRVSIVTYAAGEDVVLEGAKGSDQQAIMRAIRGLKASGSTNGEAGLKMAYELAKKNFIDGGVNRIVLASDGDLNVGMTSESDLHDFVDQQRKSGIYLSVLGFGWGNYKDTKMETLADHGNGSYHYIDSETEAARVFGDRLTANLVPFANDVKVQLEFNPAAIKGYRLVGYENRAMAAEDFKDDEKDAGEVGPESQFTVVYEIVPTDSAMEIAVPELKYGTSADATKPSDEWLTAKLRYMPLDGKDAVEQERVVKKGDFADDPGADWRFAAAVSEFGMLLRNSEFKGSSTYDSVRKLVDKTDDEKRVEFLELVDLAEHN